MSRVARLGVLAGTGAAFAAGVLLDRRFGLRERRTVLRDEHGFVLGSLRGETHQVEAEDGLVLHAEVDEIAPYRFRDRVPDRATVVFVHGFALTQDCWHFQRLAFRGKRRMVFYDQRSHGRSGRSEPEHATIDQLGRDLRDVVDALAPDEPIVLVGHSMGGMSVVALAEQHPELFGDRIVGVGLISTTAGSTRTHKIVARYVPDMVGRRVLERGLVVAAQRERLVELARRGGGGLGLRLVEEFAFGDTGVPKAMVAFVDDMIAQTPLRVLVEFIPQFDALDKFVAVDAFADVPTWVMVGTEDKLISVGHARKLHSRILGSHLVELRGGGHMPILEFADRVNANLELLFAAADKRMKEPDAEH